MYSAIITNDGATIEVVTDVNGPHKTPRQAWTKIAKELLENPKRKHISMWIDVNLADLKTDYIYSFSHY